MQLIRNLEIDTLFCNEYRYFFLSIIFEEKKVYLSKNFLREYNMEVMDHYDH